MAGDRIGRVSVGVEPEFDQAELFRQVKAATSKIPALKLPVKITARDVNAAIREVNQKNLIAIKLPVQITARAANAAIREVNRKRLVPLKTALQIDNVKGASKDIDRVERSMRRAGATARRSGGAGGIGIFAKNVVLLRSVFALARISAMATGLGFLAQALSSVTVAAGGLGAVLTPGLVGGLVAGAGGATAFGQALGTLKFAMEGVGGALQGLNEEIDQKKLLALTPAARSFVVELDRMKPALRGFQQGLQEELFTRLGDSIERITPLARDLAPQIQQTSRVMGDLALYAASVASTMGGDFERVLGTNNVLIRDMGRSVVNLSGAFVSLLAASAPFLVFVSTQIERLTVRFRDFIATQRANGGLAEYFNQAAFSLQQFGRLVQNLAFSLASVFQAALPSGNLLLIQLALASERLREITSSVEGQANIREFFQEALPAIFEMGRLVRELGFAFLTLANQPGLAIVLETLRGVVPILTAAIATITAEFGPVLVQTIANLIVLFSVLTSQAGPLNNIVQAVGWIAAALADLFAAHPLLLQVAAAIALIEAAFAAGAIVIFIGRMSALVGILGAVATAAGITAGGLTGLAGAMTLVQAAMLRFIIFARGAMAFLLGPLGLAIGGTIAAFTVAWKSSGKFRAGVTAVSDAAMAAIPGLEALTVTVSNLILKFMDLGPASNIKDLSRQTQAFSKFADAHKNLNPSETIAAFQKAHPEYVKGAKATDMLTAATKKSNDSVKSAKELYKEYAAIGVPAMQDIKDAVDPAAASNKKMAAATKAMNQELEASRDRLNNLGSVVERQRTLVDKLKNSIEELKNVQLKGTKAFSDAGFALEQQSKALELQQVQLKLSGVTDDKDPRLVALQQQLDNLSLQAQQVDLQESLKLDPLRRKLDETFNPVKEMGFGEIVKQFRSLTAEHTTQSAGLQVLETRYKNLEASIRKMDEAANKISQTSANLTTGLSAAVAAPAVIEKPMRAANESLTTSKNVLTKNVSSVRDGLRKPFQLATIDINNILLNLPARAAEGAGRFIQWSFAIGQTSGKRLIAGFEDGVRLSLMPGSAFHLLLSKEIPDFIKANKGPVTYDRTILVPAGVAIMQGLTTGLRKGFEPVKGFLKDVGPSMEEFVPDGVFGKRTAEFLVDVAAGKNPDPATFFKDLVPPPIGVDMGGAVHDPRLSFLHKTLSFADTAKMAASLAKTFGLAPPSGGQLLRAPGTRTSSGNISDHSMGLAADLSNGGAPTPQMDALAKALKPLFGTIIKQLIWRNKDQNRGFYVPDHMDHVHLAFLPGPGFSIHSGKIGKSAVAGTPYAELFQLAAQKFGVPVGLLQAVAKAESGFNRTAGSPAGARGLMQLMPATFASLGVGNNILDPKQNIFAGAKYLAEQLKKFKSIQLALAAYNAGPGAAVTALRSFGETIAYVKRVMGFLKDFGGFREHGGSVTFGKSYVVGEAGPELFVPKRPGSIISNKDLVEMKSILKEIRDTGGLRQQSMTINTASEDPATILALLEAQKRRKLSKVRL